MKLDLEDNTITFHHVLVSELPFKAVVLALSSARQHPYSVLFCFALSAFASVLADFVAVNPKSI